MIRACLLGNSHGSGLKIALDRRWKPPQFAISSYLIAGRNEPNLRPVNGRFWAEAGVSAVRSDIEGLRETGLDITAFDALLVSAVGIMPPTEAFLDSGEAPLGVACALDWLPATPDLRVARVSRQVMAELIRERFRRLGTHRLLVDIATLYRGIVVVQLYPPPAVAMLQAPENGLVARYGEHAKAVWGAFSEFRDAVLRAMILQILPRARILPVPDGAAESPGLLRAALARPGDFWHANDAYGELVLRQLAQAAADAMATGKCQDVV
jgi:hypothetical protein